MQSSALEVFLKTVTPPQQKGRINMGQLPGSSCNMHLTVGDGASAPSAKKEERREEMEGGRD